MEIRWVLGFEPGLERIRWVLGFEPGLERTAFGLMLLTSWDTAS
jgi:hypothetical protein